MAVLLELDRRLTDWLYRGDSLSEATNLVLFATASLVVYALPLGLVFLFFRNRQNERKASFMVLTATLFSWLVLAGLVGYVAYEIYGFRERPFATSGVNELFFERPDKAFPSDHAVVFAAAAATFFATRLKTWGWFFVWGGLLSSVARVMIGFHWVGDIITGWVIGLIGFAVVRYFFRWLSNFVAWSKNGF